MSELSEMSREHRKILSILVIVSFILTTSTIGRVVFDNVRPIKSQNKEQNVEEVINDKNSMFGSSLELDSVAKIEDVREEKSFSCNGDRWGNHLRLHPNQYLCAHGDQYYVGMTGEGALVWVDSKANVTQTWMKGHPGSSFKLLDDGTFVLENKKENFFLEKNPKTKFSNIQWTERCLKKFDCPYLHLHSDGVMVLNWIDPSQGWMEKNIKKIYENFEHLVD